MNSQGRTGGHQEESCDINNTTPPKSWGGVEADARPDPSRTGVSPRNDTLDCTNVERAVKGVETQGLVT